MAKDLLRLGQAADLAGVSRMTVHRWVRSGQLEAVTLPPLKHRAGRWHYVRRADVERLVWKRATERSHGRQSEQGGTGDEG